MFPLGERTRNILPWRRKTAETFKLLRGPVFWRKCEVSLHSHRGKKYERSSSPVGGTETVIPSPGEGRDSLHSSPVGGTETVIPSPGEGRDSHSSSREEHSPRGQFESFCLSPLGGRIEACMSLQGGENEYHPSSHQRKTSSSSFPSPGRRR